VIVLLIHCRSLPAINQFFTGAAQLMELACRYPSQMEKLFVSDSTEILNFSRFRSIYTVEYSEVGSNYRQQEDETIFSFEVCLQKCDGV